MNLTMQPTREPQQRIAETPLDQLTLRLQDITDWRAEPFRVRTEELTGDAAEIEWIYWDRVLERRA